MKLNKVIIWLCLFLVNTSVLIARTGTENDPFTVAEAIKKNNTTQVFWVKGYIVGEMKEYSNQKYFYNMAPPFDGNAVYLIADTPNEINLTKCMPIQSKYNDHSDLDDNPEYWRKPIMVSGKLQEYFKMPGIKSLTSFSIEASEPLFNEAQYWNFMEDFDEKNAYTPNSSEYTFAGGRYEGYDMPWNFVGSTLGDTSKDLLSYYTTAKGLHINPKNSSLSLQVFSITGQQVFSANKISEPTIIPLSKGTYILKINKENGAYKVCVM